ncbi:hypothetical protein [Corynebacterium epidermidicanis]|uniref:Uncharacterized protein n=1 Tax=Corynebacterium epidermidicanis TaxID=1050174 RepID=A0A0G3GSY2_9CORY|nr:hypothetical protein [Corynebacterium epidermidicanis]AKK04291.1 hypothetical protein CEPID_12345 [Corynebacterium epidermidicanis]
MPGTHLTITMQRIADLAHVQRPAVSQWRTRYPATHATPFPEPLFREDRPVFDVLEVARWLVDTGHGKNIEAVEDAPFYSELFVEAQSDSKVWAALLAHSRTGEEVTTEQVRDQLFADPFVPEEVFAGNTDGAVETANRLAEAAYTAENVLDHLVRSIQSNESLQSEPEEFVAAILSEVIKTHQSAEVVAWGPGSDGLVALATTSHSDKTTIYFTDPGKPAYCAAAHGHTVEGITDEFSPSALIYAQWISAKREDAQEFFEQLENVLLGLDHTGVALVVAPAELLIHEEDPQIVIMRKNLLFGSGEHFNTQLRYSALLPHGWSLRLGRRQLALWALRLPRRDTKEQGAVVLADHTGLQLGSSESHKVIADVLAALNTEVPVQLHPYLRAKVVPENLVRQRDTLRPALTPTSTDVPVASIADLRRQAMEIGIAEFPFKQDVNPYEMRKRSVIPWEKASKGNDKIVRVLSGSKLEPVDTTNPDGTIVVVGANELLGIGEIGERKTQLFELSFKLTSYHLTEPGDVIVLTTTKVKALVDFEGGKVVEAPAFIIRCKKTRGRSKDLLPIVAVPELLVEEINRAGVKDKHLWLVPVLPRDQADAFAEMTREINRRKAQMEQQLRDLNSFHNELGEAMLTGTIRGAPG